MYKFHCPAVKDLKTNAEVSRLELSSIPSPELGRLGSHHLLFWLLPERKKSQAQIQLDKRSGTPPTWNQGNDISIYIGVGAADITQRDDQIGRSDRPNRNLAS